MNNKFIAAYQRAEQKVKRIKGFYRHLTIYLIVNTFIVIEGLRGINFIEISTADIDPAFGEWLIWNVFSIPVLWGIGLLIHGIRVFSPEMHFAKQWEEGQIRRIMEKENKEKKFL